MALKKIKKKIDSKGQHVWIQRSDTRVVADALARASQETGMMAMTKGKLTTLVNTLLLKYGQREPI